MRRAVSARLLLLVAFLLLNVSFVFGQTTKPTPQDIAREKEGDDNPAARLKWFMEGRQSPDTKSPAEWMNRAMRQKFQLRMARELQMRQMMQTLSPGQKAAITVGNGSTVWTPLGPAPIEPDPTNLNGVNWNEISGRVSAIAIDPSDPTGNTVYVGGATGGVWKSTNAASTDPHSVIWTPVIDQQQTLAVGAIAVSADGNTILVGTGEAKNAIDTYYGQGILRSVDRGVTWNLITGGGGRTFQGVGISKIAFGPGSTVVAGTTAGGFSQAEGAFNSSTAWVGLWTSTDGGGSWVPATNVTDAGTPIGSITFPFVDSVIFNPIAGKFFAVIRFHGIYQSSDGLAWTRLGTQPDSTTLSLTNCPTSGSAGCLLGRGVLAIRAGKNEMYFWYVDRQGTLASDNHGVFVSIDGGASWTALDKGGIDACPTAVINRQSQQEGGCSVSQGYFYNLTIAAVENPTNTNNTDVYVGAVNIFKCTLNATSAANLTANHCQTTNPEPNLFMNITHVYGLGNCGFGGFAHLHPDQHAIAGLQGVPGLVYFGNDGGIYRTKNPAGLNTAVCDPNGTPVPLPYDSLNANIGAMTQFVWATPHPTDSTGFIAGAQDNASTMTSSSIAGTTTSANGKSFFPWSGGDGGYNAIRTDRPDIGATILYGTFTEVSVVSCSSGFNCLTPDNLVVTNDDLVATGTTVRDESAFYTPWLLDPYDPSKMIVGTCREWRGISTPGPTQLFTGVMVSQKLGNTSGALNCTAGDPDISALAAGGPKSATAGIAKVNYAAVYPTSSIWMTTAADTAALPVVWTNVSPSALNPSGYKISSLTIDQAGDPTGLTVYATIQGFGGAHVIKSTTGGVAGAWTNITGNLPDAPANTLAIDPDDHTVVYVGTDVGVFVTTNNGSTWTEVGPTLPGPVGASGFLPNVPVSRLAFSTAGGKKQLMAATYGRGIWLADLTTAQPQVSFDQASLNFASIPQGTTSAPQALKLTNSGGADLLITSIAIGGTNASSFSVQSDNCPRTPTALSAAAFCTINVTATPQAGGVLNGTVAVTDNAPGSPQSVPLSVTGTVPGVSLDKTTLTFAGQMIGSTSTAQVVTLTNNGGAPLNVTSVTITGANPGSFAVQSTTCVTSSPIAANGTCTINVTFTPQAVSPPALTANVSIADNATGSPHTVALTGTGTGSTYTAAPSPLAFGTVAIGATPTLFVTITNTGSGAMTFAAATAAPYSINGGTCGATINAGANCTVGVKYTPSAPAGAQNGTLTFTTNGVGPANVSLTGTSTNAVLNVNPNPVAFGNQLVNAASTPLAVTVTNATTSAINITTLAISGTNPGDFGIDAGCAGAALPATTGTCTVHVTFTPGASGARSAVLTIHATSQPDTTVNLTGTGAVPTIGIAPAGPIAFGNVNVGSTSPATSVTLTNNGGVDLHLTAIATAAPYAVALNTCATLPKTLAPNASCVMQVTFSPTVPGAAPATNLTITDDSGGTAGHLDNIALTGTGTQPGVQLSTGTLAFGNLNTGQTSTAQTLTVTNNGNGTLNVGVVAISGQYVKSSDTCSNAAVAPNGTCTIGVQFKPTTTGPQAGTLTIPDNAPGNPHTVSLTGTGTAPVVSFPQAQPFNFGNQVVNTSSAPQAITLNNVGTGPLTVTAVAITGTNAGDFSQTNTCTAAPVAITCTISVTFRPTATGARNATISVTDDAAGSPHTFLITGTGTGPSLELDVAGVANTTLAFGNQRKGVTSATKTFQVKNTGTADLHITTTTLGGTNATDFVMTAASNCAGATVAAGTTCNVVVTFTPAATGARVGTITVASDSLSGTNVMNLTGTGIFPAITTVPATNALDFATVKVGTTSATQTFTLTNSGTDTLNISGTTLSAAGYNVTNNCNTPTLATGASCTVLVAFAPTATGAAPGTVAINHDLGTTTLTLTGTGALAQGSPAPATVNFNFQKVGTTSTAQTITFTNSGAVQMAGLTVTKGGTGAAQYNVTPDATTPCGLTLAANASCKVQVTFAPTAAGAPTANVTFTHDGSNSPNVVNLTGTGEVPAVNPNPTVAAGVAFNGKPITTSSTSTVTLNNTSHVALAINSISIPAGGSFTQTNNCGASLAGQANCTITVTFNPTTTGAKNGTLTVTTDAAAPNNSMAFPLTGTGEDFTQAASNGGAATVTAGNAASFTMTETPAGGNFTNAITFSCTGLDSTMGCAFNPTQVTPNAAAATTSVTITTKKGGGTAPALGATNKRGSGTALLAFLLALPGMAVFFPTVGNRKLSWTKKLGIMMLLLVVMTMVLSMSGCSNPAPGTKPGTYTIGVVATSGGLSHTTNLTVTVQ